MSDIFRSVWAAQLTAFVQEKRVVGYRYISEAAHMHQLDCFLCTHPDSQGHLSRSLVESYIAKQPHERPRTHQARIQQVRHFALFLQRRGMVAYVPDSRLTPTAHLDFVPYIFTHVQIRQLLHAIDRLRPDPRSPERHRIMPELFRVLYGCGCRCGEVLRLRVADVDLDTGVLTIRQGKFRKDRLVPLTPALTDRLRRYAIVMNLVDPEAVFFPNPYGKRYDIGSIYHIFRWALRQCGIPHGGRGRGPRMHDLRHTFAVHCLERWYRQGEDLNASLPLLVAYLGHQGLNGTQRYLRLTPELFPNITARLESFLNSSNQS